MGDQCCAQQRNELLIEVNDLLSCCALVDSDNIRESAFEALYSLCLFFQEFRRGLLLWWWSYKSQPRSFEKIELLGKGKKRKKLGGFSLSSKRAKKEREAEERKSYNFFQLLNSRAPLFDVGQETGGGGERRGGKWPRGDRPQLLPLLDILCLLKRRHIPQFDFILGVWAPAQSSCFDPRFFYDFLLKFVLCITSDSQIMSEMVVVVAEEFQLDDILHEIFCHFLSQKEKEKEREREKEKEKEEMGKGKELLGGEEGSKENNSIMADDQEGGGEETPLPCALSLVITALTALESVVRIPSYFQKLMNKDPEGNPTFSALNLLQIPQLLSLKPTRPPSPSSPSSFSPSFLSSSFSESRFVVDLSGFGKDILGSDGEEDEEEDDWEEEEEERGRQREKEDDTHEDVAEVEILCSVVRLATLLIWTQEWTKMIQSIAGKYAASSQIGTLVCATQLVRNVGDCLSTFVDLLVHHLHSLFSCISRQGGSGGEAFPPSPPFCCARRVGLIEDLLKLLLRLLKKDALCLRGPDQKSILEEALSLSKSSYRKFGWVAGIVHSCASLAEQIRDEDS